MEKIQVFLVDDHPLMREALQNRINTEFDMHVLGESPNGQIALMKIQKLNPNVVIMDLIMPVMDGIQTMRQLKIDRPEIKVIILTSSNEDEKIIQAFKAGAAGYIQKESPSIQIIQAIRDVMRGKQYIQPEVAERLTNALRNSGTESSRLTVRQIEILELMREGFSNQEIAIRLSISDSTVRVHILNIHEKLKLGSRREVINYARAHADLWLHDDHSG